MTAKLYKKFQKQIICQYFEKKISIFDMRQGKRSIKKTSNYFMKSFEQLNGEEKPTTN